MSQVIRKYEGGGKSQKEPNLFEWKDVGKYDRDKLVSGMYQSIDAYIQNNGLSGDAANQFRSSADTFIKGIKNGTLIMNGDGTFTDTTGTMSSTGKYDRKFLGMGTKNNSNNAYNRVGDFALSYIKGMSPYKAQTATTTEPKKALSFQQRLANLSMGGNWDDNTWYKFTPEDRLSYLRQAGQAMHDDFLNNPEAEFNKDVFGTRENWIERSSNFLRSLEDNKYDPEDLKYSAAMGYGDLSKYLVASNPNANLLDEYRKALVTKAHNEGIYGEEAVNAYVEKGLRDQATREQETIQTNQAEVKRNATKSYFDQYKKENPYKSSVRGSLNNYNPNYHKKEMFEMISRFGGNRYSSGQLARNQFRPGNEQHLINNLDIFLPDGQPRGNYLDVGGGYVSIPWTYDFKNYSAIVYNPTTKQYKDVSMLDYEPLRELAYNVYEDPNYWKPEIEKSIPRDQGQKGQKFQQGGTLMNESDFIMKRYQDELAREKANNEIKVAEKAASTGRTTDQVAADSKPHETFSAADKVRMGALAGDVASLIASMSGVGSVASAGIGAASTAANQTADMMEGQTFGQSLWNNAGSYALDAISLIPFAKAAKVPKMIKNVSRFAPLMTTALATMQGIANIDEYTNTWGKVKKGESLNVGDWRNILNSLQLVVGGASATHRASKGKARVNAAESADKVWMKTPQGWRKVDANLAQRVSAATSVDAQNALLKDQGIQLKEAKTWGGLGKGTGVAKVETTPFYDFNKTVTTYSGDLPLEHTFGPGERWLGNAQMPDFNFPKVRNAYNSVFHPQASKRAKAAKGSTTQPKTEATSNKKSKTEQPKSQTTAKPSELLMLPAPGQTSVARKGTLGPSQATGRHTTDVTAEGRLQRPGSYVDRAVPVGGTPVQAPDAKGVRAVNAINSTVNSITPTVNPNRLPAVIPDSRNAKKVVASRTVQSTTPVAELIDSRLPQRPLTGAAKSAKEKTYSKVFHPVIEKEYNAVWDEAIKGKKDFGYEEVTPRRNAYAPPTPTEITHTPQTEIKDKNARYLWELVNKNKPSTAHVKREAPKKQTKPKAKKTSRDGKVTKKADGGLIFKFQSSGQFPVMERGKKNAWLSADNTFKNATDTSTWDSYFDMPNIIKDMTTSGVLNNQDPNKFVSTLNSLNSMDLPWEKKLNATGYKDWNTQFDSTGLNKYFGRDVNKFGYQGPSTWNRAALLKQMAGTYNSPDNALTVGGAKIWNDGQTWFQAPEFDADVEAALKVGKPKGVTGDVTKDVTGTSLKPVPTVAESVGITSTPVAEPAKDSGVTPGAGSGRRSGIGGFQVLPEDVIALGRMVGGLRTNSKAAKQYKAGLKPTFVETHENTVPIQGNYAALASADRQAAALEGFASKTRTSDASLQLAGQLDANTRAGQARFQGGMADAQEFYRTRALAQAESDAAKGRRVMAGNQNRQSMNMIEAAKAQIDSAKTTADYAQVVAPYFAGIENQFRQNRAAAKQYDAEAYRQGLLAKLQPQYNAAQEAGDINKMNELFNNYKKDVLDYSRQNAGMPWMFQRKPKAVDTVPNVYAKRGAKLEPHEKIELQKAKDFNKRMLEDNKQFHKDIMESKKQHADLLKSMSSLTAELIKKGMSWK